MKTDRELLELAARAAGYREAGINQPYTDGLLENWNPLTDDGDALRLAVKLGLWIDIQRAITETWALGPYENCRLEKQRFNGDEYAATRRAITRAAAAIGEGMK